MSNSNFDKNGVDKSGTHWLQFITFVITAFAIYFGWALFNDDSFKANPDNDPRIFANSVSISEGVTSVQKGTLTYCKFRENEKCPPWELRAKQIKHNNSKKTVYYENAILKIYDFPIF